LITVALAREMDDEIGYKCDAQCQRVVITIVCGQSRSAMLNTKAKIAAILILIVANGAYFYWVRMRRPALPAHMQPWQPLAERTPEEREQFVASSLALDNFDVKPLAMESKFVTIPRPEEWREQMIISTSYVGEGPAKDADDQTIKVSQLPWRAELIKIKIISIAASRYETVPTPEPEIILMKTKMISRDGYFSKNGIQVPLGEMVVVGRYHVNEKKDTLHKVEGAMQINQIPQVTHTSDVPLWLLPKRKLPLGETWEQIGAHPVGVPDTAPRPKAIRTLNRLVMFEDRRAAEISTTSTFYDFSPGPEATPLKHEEESLVYLDLETGEPLWYEAKDKDDREFESVVRGCNQIFTQHLIRVRQ
jgi:hypothetical protein